MHLRVRCVSGVAAAALRKPSGLWTGCSNCRKSNYQPQNCMELCGISREAPSACLYFSPLSPSGAHELTAGSRAFSVNFQEVAKLTVSQNLPRQKGTRRPPKSHACLSLWTARCEGHIPFSEPGCRKRLYLPLLLSSLHPDWPLLTCYDSRTRSEISSASHGGAALLGSFHDLFTCSEDCRSATGKTVRQGKGLSSGRPGRPSVPKSR